MAVGDSSLGFSHQMEDSGRTIRVSVIWKGRTYTLLIDSGALLKDLGHELRKLTGVKEETLRLIVPLLNEKGSKLIFPFSDDHSSVSLQEASITEDKPIRMMGVSKDELDGVLKDATADMRILGFEEEERRLRKKRSYGPNSSIKLPQGAYIICDFRTLQIPGIELNPPPSEALKRMHMLAADPGIIAIMNKHRWRVGMMTELAPVGYVGVSPQCILGFNKNHGEEISLRLRTDDLKGFRKYERIKKTLLHELAHMVYSEHDENFYALDRQLNQEADSLDWTKSRGHTLRGISMTNDYEEDHLFDENEKNSQRLGGNQSDYLENARESSVAAAYRRFSHTTGENVGESKLSKEPDPDDLATVRDETEEPNLPKVLSHSWSKLEPDPDDTIEDFAAELYSGYSSIPSSSRDVSAPEHNLEVMEIESDRAHPVEDDDEPDPDDLETCPHIEVENTKISKDTVMFDGDSKRSVDTFRGESNPGDTVNEALQAPSDPNNADPSAEHSPVVTGRETIIDAYEPDPDDQEMQRIQDSVTIISNRLMKSVNALKAEVIPSEVTNVLQTLLRIVRNIIGQPNEMKFKRLRKGNPAFKRNIINYTAAVEILSLVGFVEEMVLESGAEEAYLVLKRNDPGLLWIAKSIIESHNGS